jgi:hypothetical protein
MSPSGTPQRSPVPRAEHRLGVLFDLLRGLEIMVVDPIVVILALDDAIVATNLRSVVVDRAQIIVIQVFALRVHEQIPVAVFNEHSRPLVKEKPADVLEILPLRGGLDRQGEVPAALGRAVRA